ncbi:hypothetical protein MYCTH_45263 [Thermothelomyces thermophilus ATCC 42464]|uniref:Uncharacterized protein n=1 Tax=Thermothelomyces thermophilus (strain ATCC 42464 / BCRC 31852 / DSM 1799) TaxID=573729 RepID=G2QB53_THET4|nr:uncharacterized protein MYCTH_45263 [Thermothelomyces thermophilus ATCC 42464]AEO55991.1 hypothetical protein MYCTH_45263 [Thermothelomyces thermophilus ATCC 42464]
MVENSPCRNTYRESGPSAGRERILDRKIERRQLLASFSSNLARRGPRFEGKASDGSVRSIVSLFEKSATHSDSPASSRPDWACGASNELGGRNGRKGHRVVHNDKDHNGRVSGQPLTSQLQNDRLVPSMSPSSTTGYQVEDYSLTLLRHKSYFNNRSLARCLDEESEEDTRTKVQLVKSNKDGDDKAIVERKKDDPDEHGRGGKGDRILLASQRNHPFPKQQRDNQMSELLPRKELLRPRPQELANRNLLEVDNFWSHVRAELQVDDEEIYGTRPARTRRQDYEARPRDGYESWTFKQSSTPDASPPASRQSKPDIVHPFLPAPTRPPPPVPVAARERSLSAVSRWKPHSATHLSEPFPDLASDYPVIWDEPSPTPFRESASAPESADIASLSFDPYPEPELPLLEAGRDSSVSLTEPSHSRYPSSGSGPWTRPPTWRLPSSLYSSSPPSVPPLPSQSPLPTQPRSHRRHPANHSRNRHHHQPHSSKTSACTSFSVSTTYSINATDSSDCGRNTYSSRQTAQTSTSSTATRSTRVDSGAALSSSWSSLVYGPHPPLRRLTTEEKLSEIDAFLGQDAEPEPEREWLCHDQGQNQTDGGWI